MSNIENLRQLHHTKLNLKRTQSRVKEFYSYENDLVFRLKMRKGLGLHILRSRKEPGLWSIYNAYQNAHCI